MNRASLTALLAAVSLAAAPGVAMAACHEPEGFDAAERAADDNEEHAAVEAIREADMAPGAQAGADADTGAAGEADAAAADGAGEDAPQIEDTAILPSAEGHLESEAPTMEIDCEQFPELCPGEPIRTETVGPELSTGDDPETAEVETGAGEPVVAEPEC